MPERLARVRRLAAAENLRLEWVSRATDRATVRYWYLVITNPDVPGESVAINTGFSTVSGDRLGERVGSSIVKAAACLLRAMGPRVILPGGQPLDDAHFDEGILDAPPPEMGTGARPR